MRTSIALWVLILASPAWAVSTSHWTQTSQADFKAGTLHNVVATNLNDVKLSREVKTLLEEDPKVSMVTSLAQTADGTIYAGTAPQGKLLKISGDKVADAAVIPDAVSITALLAEPEGGLLLGVSGAKARVMRIDKPGGTPHDLFTPKDEQYIWALAELPDGTIYAATGPNGQLFAIHPYGASEEIYKSDENNLTCLVSDGKDLLYVGTDPDGLVVRINRKTKETFVLYNADEAEIAALAPDANGVLYAATGQVPPPAPPQTPEAPTKETAGRPESGTSVPLPSQPPKLPQPPPAPGPAPGQPPPIPQKPTSSADTNLAEPLMLFDDPGPGGGGGSGGDQPVLPEIPGTPDQSADAASQAAGKEGDKTGKAPGEAEAAKPQGNAIYRIDREGFVTEIFRQQTVIYSMIASNGVLLVGTGDDGEIYQVDPAAQETEVVAKTDSKEVSALLATADGRVYLGLSNTGAVAAMTNGYAQSGTFTSPVLDASQVSRFGVIQMHGSLPKGTGLGVMTRSGNIKDADASGWGPWTTQVDAQEYLRIASPAARFFQYRVSFTTSDPAQSPVINDVDVSYQLPHLAPVIRSIKLTDAGQAAAAGGTGGAGAGAGGAASGKDADTSKSPGGTGQQTITWDSFDLDGDDLVYALYFRIAPGGPWILLKDKLSDTTYAWDTHGVADGRYQVKVTASDALANPPGEGKTASRVSDVLVVDNTPPVMGDLKVSAAGNSAQIDLRVIDQTSTVASMEYSVDSSDVWQSVLPTDKIFDQPEETVAITVPDLAAGAHQITLRAEDAVGNVALQTVSVTVGPK